VLLEDDEADIALLASQTEDTLDDIKSQVSAPPPTGVQPLESPAGSVTMLVKDMKEASVIENLAGSIGSRHSGD
tara:strand:- start:434 stop:655 length:222 start_codon:yes stop_codon:yes gene_type:complete